ncbi:MAG: hypothetical protein WAL67_00170 [Candidatus Cybelea sp.]
MKNPISVALAVTLLAATAPSGEHAGAAGFDAAVAQQRVDLSFANGTFGGPGAAVIAKAVAGAQYVMIGEDHGIAEIPAFSTALCTAIAPQGFDALALEVGPSTAAVLTSALGSADPSAAVAAYDAKHPFSIAFYDFTEEYAFLRACRDAVGPKRFALWGLDQELTGSSSALLAAALASASTADERSALRQLIAQDDTAFANAMKSGDPGDMAMVKFDLLHDKRADFGFMMPFFRNLGTTPVLYDLRALRSPFVRSGMASVNLERVIDGYDLLVVIPVAHPSHQVSTP